MLSNGASVGIAGSLSTHLAQPRHQGPRFDDKRIRRREAGGQGRVHFPLELCGYVLHLVRTDLIVPVSWLRSQSRFRDGSLQAAIGGHQCLGLLALISWSVHLGQSRSRIYFEWP